MMARCHSALAVKTAGDKKPTTIRLTPVTKTKLENVAHVTKKSESLIVEEALGEYFKNHGYNARYVMGTSEECYVLIKQEGEQLTVLDTQNRNGLPLQSIRESYAAKFNTPVELLEETDK